tara:strand:+ start:15351 stop:16055 length:705 start_codon:yes stop_codon:yes gene_type:complete
MTNQTYIVYYRASTESQRDGLGIDAQKTAVNDFISKYGGKILHDVEEIISGGSLTRKGFNKALELAKGTGSTLLVHRIDRLSRSGFMTIALLEEQGVPFIEATSPNDSPFSKNIKFLVAKEERDKTKERVKNALQEINSKIQENGHYISKAGNKITSLGKPENLSDKGRENSIATRREKALNNPNNRRAIAAIRLMRGLSLSKKAKYLNTNGFLTSTGKRFYPVQVSNLIKLYG